MPTSRALEIAESEELDLELENDEEDDDVTFDDLLRAAEEADREKVSKE